MDQSYRIVRFGPFQKAPAKDLATLHMSLLPHSPLTLLGHRFLRKWHYSLLPRGGFIFGAVAYVGERPAGFICATLDSNGFMGAALRRHFLRWVWAFGSAVLRSPRAIVALWELFRIMMARNMSPCQGEILSMGVLPAYRNYRFADDSGLHLANDLLDTVMEVFRERGIGSVRAIADTNNYIAHRFYIRHGASLENDSVPGWRVPSVEFILRPTNP
jgi:ribosomal protein S18 acetylase RimI-like enzyme